MYRLDYNEYLASSVQLLEIMRTFHQGINQNHLRTICIHFGEMMRSEARNQFIQHGAKKVKTVETSELKVLGRNRGKSSQSRSCHQHLEGTKKRTQSFKHAGKKVINENEEKTEDSLCMP